MQKPPRTAALPQPDRIPDKEKDAAMGAYLMMFASWALGIPLPFIGLIASVIYYFVNRASKPFTRFHALQALLMHIPLSIVNAALAVWFFIALSSPKLLNAVLAAGAVVIGVLNIIYVIVSIVAARYAKTGGSYIFRS